ncbi:helix-turn-helix transcriptional regulator [Rhodococcus opacus]|uniref:helix-turn-helix transcriptional regulator n=1 Tax=Rhodococcus opacus TaxID=37919 RepID=UPI00247533C5|nr:helix-turn-helix transcriptional regulator [Rhodococcus opacus]MDH6293067.1 transcriptional regulator with XRE-family HTH domain [Rhodococcus opacus]
MDSRNDIREFLASRRARITPQQAGLATYGRRRVPGLRREEVAMLAGVSTDYYARLERGTLTGVSDSVLDALARALQLDEAEHAHLYDLAHAANTTPRTRRRPAPQQQVRSSVQRILDGMTALPAIVMNARLDLLSANRLGYALYVPAYADPVRPVNLARFCFLDPQARAIYPKWDDAADITVAMLRTEAGRNPYDLGLSDLVGELSTRSGTFRNRWATHNVRLHRSGIKRFHHPVVGDLRLTFDVMELPADTGLTLTAYSAEPDTPSHDGLTLLASWAATLDQTDRADTDFTTDNRNP